MLRSIFLFEIRYHLKYPLIYCLALVFFLFTFGAEVSDSFQLGGSIGNEYRNAPIVILRWLTIMSIMGLLVVTAFVAGSIQRDFARNTYELIFSRPVGKFDYLMGRFSGSMMLTLWVIIGSVLGIIVGSYMPWLEPERLGPFRLAPYLYALFVIILPNLFLIGAVFFTLAGLTRSMLTSFMGAIFILVAWAISAFAMKGLEGEFLASLLDPFGFAALTVSTKYWTIIEKNSALPPVEGALLLNRLIWIGIGLAVFIYGYYSFHFTEAAAKKRFWRKSRIIEEPDSAFPDDVDKLIQTPTSASRTFSLPTSLRQLWYRTRLETVGVFKSIPFIVILVFSVFNVFGGVVVTGDLMGTPVYPVTHTMLQAIHNSYLFMLIIIITFYSGELVWREQSLKLNEVIDSLPVPNWVFLGSKLLTLSLVVVIFTLAGVFATMGYQIYRGYTNFEIGLYTKGIAMAIYPYILICVLACTIQVLANNKFLGYLLMIIYLVSAGALEVLGLEHYIYQYARSPSAPYSDMNGYGHFLQPFFWYNLYWTFAAVILGVLCSMFWVRGTESGWKTHLKLKGPRLRSTMRTALILGLVGFISSGVFIFYNTCILNEYLPKQEKEKRLAEYEKRYRQYKDVAMPRITDVKADVDIYPEDRRVEIEGRYVMENRSSAPIESLHVTIPPRVTIRDIRFRENEPVLEDSVLGYYIYELGDPLLPGDTLAFDFDLLIENPGFVNNGSNVRIVKNGTFIDNIESFPMLGYNEFDQLQDRNTRRKYDLPPVQRMNKIDDEHARRNTYFTKSADRVSFETTVSTSADQIAIAPGYLEDEWIEGDRHYFHYRMDRPILNFFSYLCARYSVKRDSWNDVAIEIYYHKPHVYNLDRMIDAVKKSLDYYTAQFGPYQFRQVRIVEFPRYATFAQSFPNTIPYSESAGFITEVKEGDDIDYVFYITAHEVAHQWWGHQVIGANVQGATLLSESLAQYSALMVMEKEYGSGNMRRFLKYELDKYLRERGGELVEELPLLLVEDQPYIHYEKGSVIMYALRDYLGEGVLNGALRRYRDAVAYQEPPYTTSLELMDYIREATPDSIAYILEDMFETITLYMNYVEEATCTRREDGRYVVDLAVKAKKLRADGQGRETEIPLDDWIDIGVFGQEQIDGRTEEKILYLKKHRIKKSETTFHLVVEEKPVSAGIDPYNKLIDRDSGDNVTRVTDVP